MTVLSIEEVLEERKNGLLKDKIVTVYISGSWDLFHIGHLTAIKKAKMLGDKLIVGVSTNELIKEYKKREPIFPYKERIEIVSSLRYVDRVVTQYALSTTEQFKELDFDILVVGEDWKDKYLEGIEWIKNHKEKFVVYLPRTLGISSSEIRNKLEKIHENI